MQQRGTVLYKISMATTASGNHNNNDNKLCKIGRSEYPRVFMISHIVIEDSWLAYSSEGIKYTPTLLLYGPTVTRLLYQISAG